MTRTPDRTRGIAALFAAAGVSHFLIPGWFERIVPPWLPDWLGSPRTVVYVSGAAELAGAIGVLIPATRVAAGWGLLVLLVAVFPANVQMLVDARAAGASAWYVAALWLRLPLQPLLGWWVWRHAVRPHAPRGEDRWRERRP